MINDPLFYLVGLPAALIFGVSKGGLGGGLGVLAVPLMSLVMTPAQAAGILLPMLLVLDLAGLKAYWRQWDLTSLTALTMAALAGIALGGLAFGLVSADLTRLLVGCIAVAFSAWYFFTLWRAPVAAQKPAGHSLAGAAAAGAMSGFTSTLAHAGGPPVTMYLLRRKLPQAQFVATTVALFFFINLAKVVPYALLGQFSQENLKAGAVLAPTGLLGIWLGIRLQQRLSQVRFYRICYALLALVGLRLIASGLGY
ncbi:MAG: sulfite exporter TauE/SafE family protein [Pseudomonadota bacterium]